MRLAWRMYNNPIYDSSSPLYRELNKFQISQAEFSTLADGGFADAYLTLEDVTNDVLDEAFDTWLAKRIVVTDGAGNIAWEGLVTELSITNGYQIRGQTLDAFCNRVFVDYTYGGGNCPNGAQRLSGAARINARSSDANGYVFLGVRWYDKHKRAMYDHSITTTEGKPLKKWIDYAFNVSVPYDDYRGVKFVSLCFISGAYEGSSLRARVDDASLK